MVEPKSVLYISIENETSKNVNKLYFKLIIIYIFIISNVIEIKS